MKQTGRIYLRILLRLNRACLKLPAPRFVSSQTIPDCQGYSGEDITAGAWMTFAQALNKIDSQIAAGLMTIMVISDL